MKTDYKEIELYAKRYKSSNGYEYQTIYEHTMELVNNLEKLFEEYSAELKEGLQKIGIDSEKFKYLLWLVSLYHDLGKANTRFQSKIRDKKKSHEVPLDRSFPKEVPHSFISLAFVNLDEIENENLLTFEEEEALLFSIAFSHDRDFNVDKEYLKRYIQQDVAKYIENPTLKKCFESLPCKIDGEILKGNAEFIWKLMDQLKRELLKEVDLSKYEIKLRTLLKGFLHRLDHASSAKIIVEDRKIDNFPQKVEFYLKTKGNFNGFKEFQKKAIEFSNENVILYAPTGSGKTEFALNWAKKSKLIYTLPIRVSINAMYERLSKIFSEDKVGILHSDSSLYLFSKEDYQGEEIESLFNSIQLSKSMSLPIIVTTGDQIFNAALKWPGFEKIYSMFLYSKLVIDEPQSYSPESLAIILRTLEEVVNINGRFCLMSATINPLINNYLSKSSMYMQAYSDEELAKMQSHVISLKESSILDILNTIIDEAKDKKILVLCNTVKCAQEVYKAIKEEIKKSGLELEIDLLHSRFLENQRRQKEQKVLNNHGNGIFISTQIVEASLDIDFDILFTELCPADSLLQRMGRIYRKRRYESSKPNVVILTKDISGLGRIYEEEIIERTHDFLKDFDNMPVSELDKKSLNEYVYDTNALSGTSFMDDFKKAYNILKAGYKADTKAEAQKIFRNVMTITAIPESIFSKYNDEIEQAMERLHSKALSAAEKLRLISLIRGYTVNVPAYYFSKTGGIVLDKNLGVVIVSCDYDNELGVVFSEKDKDNVW